MNSLTNSSAKDLADAYYMMGWGELQNGDHSGAYQVWERGHSKVPWDKRLTRQCGKRRIWDVPWDGDMTGVAGLLGAGAEVQGLSHPGGSDLDAEAFSVPDFVGLREPALGCFDAETQRRRLVFRSRQAFLTPAERTAVVDLCNAHAAKLGGWGTVRNSTEKTTDVAVEDIEELRPWLRALIATRLAPFL